MPIDLGLGRISKLLAHLGNPHTLYKSIHVAGTNGKGSTVAYLLSILTQCLVRNGKFTSPHLLYYNDCISINNETYPLKKFERVNKLVHEENSRLQLECTEFEILTVTAFKIFELEQVQMAVIEVGLGGRLDATNVLEPGINGGVVATGITKIGIDHEGFLGSTLPEIAGEKAGIIKAGVPVVVDSTNEPLVLDVIQKTAKASGAKVVESGSSHRLSASELIQHSPLKGAYQVHNLGVALGIVDSLWHYGWFSESKVQAGIAATLWPGRLQQIEISTGVQALLDGAHNESAAVELAKYLGTDRHPIILVIALTKGKSIDGLLKHIARPGDTIICTTYTAPDQMPWVSSYTAEEVAAVAKEYAADVEVAADAASLLQMISHLKKSDFRNVVICGSLYLCADVLRQCATRNPNPHGIVGV